MSKKILIKCPATIANFVCGFDILGFALEEPADIMIMERITENKIIIEPDPVYHLPTQPERNVAGVSLLEMLKTPGITGGFRISIQKKIKPGSGIGSSAASSAGAVVGANYLLNNIFSPQELVQFAMFGEKLASGVKHADNIAPAICGGISLIRSIHPLDIINLPVPKLFVTIVHPQIEVRTEDARAILKQNVLLKDAIRQWGNIAALISGITLNDTDLISRAMQDHIIEPVRSILIPGFDEIKSKCLKAGALGGGIAGSGPSIFMLSKTAEMANSVGHQMQIVFEKLQIPHAIYQSGFSKNGCTVTEL